MLKRIHNELGTAGLVIAVVALVAAVAGTAFAAGGLTKQQEKQVKKIAKKFAGKPGKTGTQGPKGDAGSQGSKGDQGPKGDTGNSGAPGEDGSNGEPGACSVGNNECVLPPGGTLTGVWSFRDRGSPEHYVSLSFPLQVIPRPEYGEGTISCPGSAAEPKAEPGFVCFYPIVETNTFLNEAIEPTTSGMVLNFASPDLELQSYGWGTWAVTQRCPIDPETELEEEC